MSPNGGMVREVRLLGESQDLVSEFTSARASVTEV